MLCQPGRVRAPRADAVVDAAGECVRARYEIATMRSIGIRARSAIAAGTRTSCTPSRRPSRSFVQRDHLHEDAAGLVVGRDELDVGRGHAQLVQHAGLGRHDRRAAGARAAARVVEHPAGGEHVHALGVDVAGGDVLHDRASSSRTRGG